MTCSRPCRWKVWWSVIGHKTFLELHSWTVLEHSPQTTEADGDSRKLRDPKLIWKHFIYNLFKAKIFTLAAKLKTLEQTQPEVGAWAWPKVEGVNVVFSNHRGIAGMPDFTCVGVLSLKVLFFGHFLKQVPICFSCLAVSCDVVLLWSPRNVMQTTKLHLTFHLIFGVNLSFNRKSFQSMKCQRHYTFPREPNQLLRIASLVQPSVQNWETLYLLSQMTEKQKILI